MAYRVPLNEVTMLPAAPEPISLQLTIEQYAAIGRLMAEFSMVDHYLDRAIWKLAAVYPGAGACMTAQIPSADRKLKALMAVIRLRLGDIEQLKKLNKYNKILFEMSKLRNRTVHDTWSRGQDTGNLYRLEVTADRNLSLSYVPVDLTELKRKGDYIMRCRWVLVGILRDVFELFDASLEIAEKQQGGIT
jgi:hypothetical protein